MTTLERKKYLKKKIEHLSDRNLMEKIDSTFESNPYILSDEEKKRVTDARVAFQNGECVYDEHAKKMTEEWFAGQGK